MSNELLRTRIGNTVTVVLPVLTRGDAVSLVGRDITIMLVDPNDTKTPVSFTIGGVSNNIATFVVEGASQTATGTYRAEVYENYRGTAMAVYDCDIFVLVARTEYENDGNEGVSSETTTLDPINIAWVGRDGYTPYIQDGYWYINGTSTNVKAAGENGDTPYIENGYWYIGGVSTGIKVDYTNEEAQRSAAEQVRVVAEAARVQAEAARTLAENSRLTEESGRSAAEGVRILAERDRQAEEAMRQTNEEIRTDNETARVEAELGRAASEASRAQVEATRVANESARTTAEATRAANEQTRVSDETDRAAAETARIAAETARETAEGGRTSAEATRVSNEQTRVSNETTRQSNESARQSAETARQAAYVAAENARDAAFAEKEATRDAANEAALNCAEELAALGPKIDEVEDKVDALAVGKFYGYKASSSALPSSGDEDGYAYVGTAAPFAIYNATSNNGTLTWTDSGTTISNLAVADEEDIDYDANGKLQFANRVAATNQKGYKILRKGVALSTQMTDANTIYEVRYAFDLNGGTLTIPNGCTLKFDGGRISNGTIVGNHTIIVADIETIFNEIIVNGSWNNDCSYPEWFGACDSVDYDSKRAFQNAIDVGYNIIVSGQYYMLYNSAVKESGDAASFFSLYADSKRITGINGCKITILADGNNTERTTFLYIVKDTVVEGVNVEYDNPLFSAWTGAQAGFFRIAGSNVKIKNCSAKGLMAAFINVVSLDAVNLNVLDNYVEDCDCGVIFQGGRAEVETEIFLNSVIDSNYIKKIHNPHSESFSLWGVNVIYSGLKVTNNTFEGGYRGGTSQIHTDSKWRDCIIANNTLIDNGALNINRAENIILENNICYGSGYLTRSGSGTYPCINLNNSKNIHINGGVYYSTSINGSSNIYFNSVTFSQDLTVEQYKYILENELTAYWTNLNVFRIENSSNIIFGGKTIVSATKDRTRVFANQETFRFDNVSNVVFESIEGTVQPYFPIAVKGVTFKNPFASFIPVYPASCMRAYYSNGVWIRENIVTNERKNAIAGDVYIGSSDELCKVKSFKGRKEVNIDLRWKDDDSQSLYNITDGVITIPVGNYKLNIPIHSDVYTAPYSLYEEGKISVSVRDDKVKYSARYTLIDAIISAMPILSCRATGYESHFLISFVPAFDEADVLQINETEDSGTKMKYRCVVGSAITGDDDVQYWNNISNVGSFSDKPNSISAGFQYFCTSGASIDGGTTEKTNIIIYYTGSGWVDANGNAVVAKA